MVAADVAALLSRHTPQRGSYYPVDTLKGTLGTCHDHQTRDRICKMRLALFLLATLTLPITAASSAVGACDISPRANTSDAIAGDLQRSGCRNGDIATVTGLP